MKNFYTQKKRFVFLPFLLLLFGYSDSYAQCDPGATVLIFTEDFESHGNTANGGSGRYSSPNDFYDGVTDDDYWGRVDGVTQRFFLTDLPSSTLAIHSQVPYSNWNGAFYYAGEDMDDLDGTIGSPDGLDIKSVSFSGISIDGATSMCFSALFARGENDACNASTYDAADYIKVYYEIDGGGEIEGMCFNADLECNIPADITNEPLYHDPNCDGDGGEGTILTAVLQEFTFDIAGTGTSMDLRIEVHMDAGSEEIAFDYLRIRSETVVLPIELIAFDAKKMAKEAMVTWTTATETNNDYFEIERSMDGERFEVIGIVDGAGDSGTRLEYTFMDSQPEKGINYYRMKQVDFDGKYSTSAVVTVDFGMKKTELAVSPNPFINELSLNLTSSFNQDANIKIYDLMGRMITAQILNKDQTQKTLDLSNLDSGIYILQVGEGENATIQKIVKY